MITIMVGISGSGKSTRAFKKYPNAVVCSSDEKVDLEESACIRKYIKLILEGENDIVVDNPNTTIVELSTYVNIANAFGREYVIELINATATFGIRMNRHNTPNNLIYEQFENIYNLKRAIPKSWNLIELDATELEY